MPVVLSIARYTRPYVPSPMRFSFSNESTFLHRPNGVNDAGVNDAGSSVPDERGRFFDAVRMPSVTVAIVRLLS